MKKGLFALLVAFAMLAGQMYSLPEVDAATHVASREIEGKYDNGLMRYYHFPDGTKLEGVMAKAYDDIFWLRRGGNLGTYGHMANDTIHFVYDNQTGKFYEKDVDDVDKMLDWSSTVLVKAEVSCDVTEKYPRCSFVNYVAVEYVVKVLDKQGNLHDYRLLCEKIDPLHQKQGGDFSPESVAEYIPDSTELDPGRTAYQYPSVTLATHDNPEWDVQLIREDPSELQNEKYDEVRNFRLTPGDVETINRVLNEYAVDY